MQKAINTLTARIEALNKEFLKAEKRSDEPEMLSDYEFSINDMGNIQTEIMELQFAINILNKTSNTLSKLKSLRLCLSVHPDNEPHSEFEDRLEDLNELIKQYENN